MNYIIGCDAHKHYPQFAVYEGDSLRGKQVRVEHERGAIREFLSEFPEGTPVALESIGNWYWIVDEMEQAGCQPLLAHPAKAKAMMGNVNKTDKLDARGLATLLRNGTLPRVWIAPNEVRDQRELPRTRMALCKIRVALKNRIQPRLAAQAVNSDRRDDILIWRYKKEKLEELGPFADSLLGFASHFVPAVREGASRVGLLPSASKKRGWFGK